MIEKEIAELETRKELAAQKVHDIVNQITMDPLKAPIGRSKHC